MYFLKLQVKIRDFVKRKLPKFVCDIFLENQQIRRKTGYLHIDEKCIGWGLCKNNCPADAIELQMKKTSMGLK